MTKAQAIKGILAHGWAVWPSGRYSIYAVAPGDGHEGLYDPRDLLAEIERGAVRS